METKLEDPSGRPYNTQSIQYTSGEAKDLVKNFIYLPSEEGYREAMRILHNRYGDTHKVLVTYRKEIKAWPAVKAGDAAGFRRFFNFLVKCKSLLSENKMNTLINNPNVICMLLSKLPTYLQDKWNRKVYKFRLSDDRGAELVNLIEMVDKETILINDSLFSREAVNQYVHKPDKFNQQDRRKNIKSYLAKTKMVTEIEEVSKRKCPACDKKHDLETCQLYLAKPIEERSKFLLKNKLRHG